MFCARSVVAMYMTFRRLCAWPLRSAKFACHLVDNNFRHLSVFHFRSLVQDVQTTPLPVMDVSAPTTMKGAAKCDEHCELQDSVNQ